jgi:histidine ammonia-lyase
MENQLYDGQLLRPGDLNPLLSGRLSLSHQVWNRVEENRRVLENLLNVPGQRYYGINTGFGSLYTVDISQQDVEKLQVNLLRSHACGVGPAVPSVIVRLTLLLKILSLSQGCSGIRKELLELLLDMYNHRITPVVPSMGSLGASGDLAPLAHLCLPLIGEGEVVYRNEQMPALKALQLAGLDPMTLAAKEGLALINGTQFSLAWLIYALDNAMRLIQVVDMSASLSMEAFDCHPALHDAGIHEVRNQKGQIASAAFIRKWLEGSEIQNGEKQHLQDPYSFRCAPQVHGATRDLIDYALTIAQREINAVTDNPLVLMDEGEGKIVSGGNFHAQPLALISDFLSIALAELGSISERRSYLLLSGQRGLPAALAVNPGLESGMMICQYTAASIVNRNKILAHPASTDSIVTSAGQEDHVSMAAGAGMKLYEIVNNVWKIMAIEWMIACQAMENRQGRATSPALTEKWMAYRLHVPPLSGDRSLAQDIDVTDQFLRRINFN